MNSKEDRLVASEGCSQDITKQYSLASGYS